MSEQVAPSTVADPFRSMGDFWAALASHSAGARHGSIWDTYESGERRQLEQRLAVRFGAQDGVALCSGMGAITTTLVALAGHFGSGVEDPKWCGYFEILDLLEEVLGPIAPRVAPAEGGIRLLEPVANEPALRVNFAGFSPFAKAIVVDTSLFSCSIPFSAWQERATSPVCAVESLPKFVCRAASGGLVYGDHAVIETVRETGRRMGTLLNRQASQHCLATDLEGLPHAIARRAANADVFADVLRASRPDLVVRIPHEIARAAGEPRASSSLVFAIYDNEEHAVEEFDRWASRAASVTGRAMVRAGYGWEQTYGRAYGADRLNTTSATPYLRFSVGLEPQGQIRQLARFLVEGSE